MFGGEDDADERVFGEGLHELLVRNSLVSARRLNASVSEEEEDAARFSPQEARGAGDQISSKVGQRSLRSIFHLKRLPRGRPGR
jgi:hypothetical protein